MINNCLDEKCESWDRNLVINDVLRDSLRRWEASQDFPHPFEESNKIQKFHDDGNNVMIIQVRV